MVCWCGWTSVQAGSALPTEALKAQNPRMGGDGGVAKSEREQIEENSVL